MNGVNTFESMTEDDLDWVVENERLLHAYPWTHGNFVDALSAGYVMQVLRVDGEPVAYAVMLLILDEAHLLNLSVIPSMHNRGIGRSFLQHLFGIAAAHGATQLFLEVRPSNSSALALYRSVGFMAIGRRKRYYPAQDGGREDAILMRIET